MLPAFRQLSAVRVTYHHSPGAPRISRRAGTGAEPRWWGQCQQPPVVQNHQPQERHICASHHLQSQERGKGASTKGAGALLLGRISSTWHCRAVLELCMGQADANTHLPSADSTALGAAAQPKTGKSCLLCAPVSGSHKSSGMIFGKTFFPFCLLLSPTLKPEYTLWMGFLQCHQCSFMLRSLYKPLLYIYEVQSFSKTIWQQYPGPLYSKLNKTKPF